MRNFKHITGPLLADHFARNVRIGADGRPDGRDCRAVSDELYSDSKIARLAREMHGDDQAFAMAGGVRSRGGYGKSARAGGITRGIYDAETTRRAGEGQDVPGMRALEGCDEGPRCDGDILGFSTLGAGLDPNAGPLVNGNPPQGSGAIAVQSGNAHRYQPHYFFWEGRDRLNDFEVTPCYLVAAEIGGTQQLVGGNSVANAITNSVFALTDLPLDVGWTMFGDTRSTQLQLTMANYVAGTSLDYNFVWWGNVVDVKA